MEMPFASKAKVKKFFFEKRGFSPIFLKHKFFHLCHTLQLIFHIELEQILVWNQIHFSHGSSNGSYGREREKKSFKKSEKHSRNLCKYSNNK